MKFSIINKNNIITEIAEGNSIAEIKNKKDYSNCIIIPSESYHIVGFDLNTYKPVSNKEKIEKGEIALASNQIYDAENDYIMTLASDQEYRDGQIVKLNFLEQYQKGVLTEEEYLEKTDTNRQLAYQDTTDRQVIKLMRSYLNSNKSKLNAEQKALLNEINNAVAEIKENNPKETTQETEKTSQK
jgi:hypothetical protein